MRGHIVILSLALFLIPVLQAAPDRAAAVTASTGSKQQTLAIRAGRILTVSQGTIVNGTILIRNGKIIKVGPSAEIDFSVPADVEIVEFPHQTIVPGLVATASTLGRESSDTSRSLAPDSMILDSFDFFRVYKSIVEGGVTTLGVSSASNRLLSGRGLVIKSAGSGDDVRQRILKKTAGFAVNLRAIPKIPLRLYEPPVQATPDTPFEVIKLQPPVSRGGAFLAIKNIIERAYQYRDQLDDFHGGKGPMPELDADMTALQDLINKQDYLQVRVDRAHDILRILELSTKLDLPLVLQGVREAHKVADRLVEKNIAVIVNGNFIPGSPRDEDLSRPSNSGEFRDDLAASLIMAGVKVAIKSPSNESIPHLLYQAVEAVRHGLTPDEALRAITLSPAEILGVSDRVGSIEPGKDADLLVLSDHPFTGHGRPTAVYIDGEMIYPAFEKSPQDITLIRCGKILTVTQGEITDGIIVVRNGKIVAVGTSALLRNFATANQIIDATDEIVIPGMVDTVNRLGIHEDSIFRDSSSNQEKYHRRHSFKTPFRPSRSSHRSSGGGKATFRIVDAIDFQDPQFKDVLQSGITSVVMTPKEGKKISGQLTAMKIAGKSRESMILKDPAGLLISSLSESVLSKAKKYHDSWVAYEKFQEKEDKKPEKSGSEDTEQEEKQKQEAEKSNKKGQENLYSDILKDPPKKKPDENSSEKKVPPAKKKVPPKKPERNEEYDVLRLLFKGELLAVIQVSSDEKLKSVLAEITDKYLIKTIVCGMDEFSRDSLLELQRRNVGILLGTHLYWKNSKYKTIHTPRTLTASRVRLAFGSGAGSGSRDLPIQVAYAVRQGWEEEEALRAMTLYPAQLFGLDDRIGSIEPGKDADLVFLNGNPFSMMSTVKRVMVDGEMVFERGLKN